MKLIYLSYGAQGGIWNHCAAPGPWRSVYCIVGEVFWEVYLNTHSILKAICMTDLPWSSFFFSFINHKKSTGTEDRLSRQASFIHVSWLWGNVSRSILGLILSNLWTVNDHFWKLQVDGESQRAGKKQTKSILRARLGRNLWDIQWWMSLTSVLGNALNSHLITDKTDNIQSKPHDTILTKFLNIVRNLAKIWRTTDRIYIDHTKAFDNPTQCSQKMTQIKLRGGCTTDCKLLFEFIIQWVT